MTLNGVMAVILRYFSEFAYLPGLLGKSSRSLSHLLMSSCTSLVGRQGHPTCKNPSPEKYAESHAINHC